MPRRHGGSKGTPRSKQQRPLNRKQGSMKRWEKSSDVPLDEEDQCMSFVHMQGAVSQMLTFQSFRQKVHASRDRILLDGEDVHSDDEGDEEEVFSLKGISDVSDESDEEGDEEEHGDEGEEDAPQPRPSKASKSKQHKGKQKTDGPSFSDDGSHSEEEEDEEEESWGRKKSAYYVSNADDVASDDEEANELEEQEAKRLQAKARDSMKDEDFGLADLLAVGTAESEGCALHEIIECFCRSLTSVHRDLDEPVLSVQLQSLPQDKPGLLRHLQKTNPEALALAGDWDSTARTLVKTQQQIAECVIQLSN